MDIYHVWCNLKLGVSDVDFSDKAGGYLGRLREDGLIEGWRLTRRKLGLAPSHLAEFHIMIEVRDLRQLDEAFEHVAARRDPVEGLHFAVNSLVTDVSFALYRDFPDTVRQRGEERF